MFQNKSEAVGADGADGADEFIDKKVHHSRVAAGFSPSRISPSQISISQRTQRDIYATSAEKNKIN